MKESKNKENSCFICAISLSANASFFFLEIVRMQIDEWKILFSHLVERDLVFVSKSRHRIPEACSGKLEHPEF